MVNESYHAMMLDILDDAAKHMKEAIALLRGVHHYVPDLTDRLEDPLFAPLERALWGKTAEGDVLASIPLLKKEIVARRETMRQYEANCVAMIVRLLTLNGCEIHPDEVELTADDYEAEGIVWIDFAADRDDLQELLAWFEEAAS